jgi:nicotinamide-nucleotide amidase
MVFPPEMIASAEAVIRAAQAKKLRLVTAESCTGGLITACLTEIPGASDVVDRGYVVYSYSSKIDELSVSRKTLLDFGAVSAATALEMAEGALRASGADVAVSATGIEKPVGLVYLGAASRREETEMTPSYTQKNLFKGGRAGIRLKTVEAALALLQKEIDSF